MKLRFRVGRFVSALVLLSATMLAQDAPYLAKGTSEINVFGGASYGLGAFGSGFGGNYAYSATKNIMPYAEIGYFPGVTQSTIKVPIGGSNQFATGTDKLPFTDFHGGVHIRMPIPGKNLVPYAVLGFGGIRNGSRTVNLSVPLGNGQTTNISVPVTGETQAAFNGGFGLRYYFKENFGIRFEAKGYKGFGTYSDPFAKFCFGIFYYVKR